MTKRELFLSIEALEYEIDNMEEQVDRQVVISVIKCLFDKVDREYNRGIRTLLNDYMGMINSK